MNSKILRGLKHHTPTLLSIVASLGVVATAALSVRATPKAVRVLNKRRAEGEQKPNKLDMVKATWHLYIPAALVGISTIGCIFGANALNRRQQASLASAYALISQSYKEYQKKLKSYTAKKLTRRLCRPSQLKKWTRIILLSLPLCMARPL